jgi:hypothetical protein
MTFHKNATQTAGFFAALVVLALLLVPGLAGAEQESQAATTTYIVQAATTEQAVELVERVGGTVTHELGIIDAVAASSGPASGASGATTRRR